MLIKFYCWELSYCEELSSTQHNSGFITHMTFKYLVLQHTRSCISDCGRYPHDTSSDATGEHALWAHQHHRVPVTQLLASLSPDDPPFSSFYLHTCSMQGQEQETSVQEQGTVLCSGDKVLLFSTSTFTFP